MDDLLICMAVKMLHKTAYNLITVEVLSVEYDVSFEEKVPEALAVRK